MFVSENMENIVDKSTNVGYQQTLESIENIVGTGENAVYSFKHLVG